MTSRVAYTLCRGEEALAAYWWNVNQQTETTWPAFSYLYASNTKTLCSLREPVTFLASTRWRSCRSSTKDTSTLRRGAVPVTVPSRSWIASLPVASETLYQDLCHELAADNVKVVP